MPTVLFLQKKYLANVTSLDADLLLTLATKKTREFILIHPEYKLSSWQKIRFYYFLFQYKRGVPIAYLTRHKEFFGLDFFVNRHTLIPRPETELLVAEAIKEISNPKIQISNKSENQNSKMILIDVGTGTGCIPIAILKNIKLPIKTIAIDISRLALKVAKKNAKLHGAKIKFLHGNLLESVLQNFNLSPFNFHLIVTANLPYLTKEQFKNEQTIRHEPRSALVAAENGLALYRELLEQIKQLHQPLTAFFEFDPRQTELLTKLIYSILPNATVKIKKDLAGRDRLAIISAEI